MYKGGQMSDKIVKSKIRDPKMANSMTSCDVKDVMIYKKYLILFRRGIFINRKTIVFGLITTKLTSTPTPQLFHGEGISLHLRPRVKHYNRQF